MDKYLKPTACEGCSRIYLRKRAAKRDFCSSKCHSDFMSRAYIAGWLQGAIDPTRAFDRISNIVRNYLLKQANYACIRCGWNERHPVDGLALVQIHHIDGNSRNNRPENLEVLCPNCHSLTPKNRGRNRGNGRSREKRGRPNGSGWTVVHGKLPVN